MKALGEKVLVVLSGGQDSTTCLYWAVQRFSRENIETVTFDYGQRHKIEIECARRVARHANVENTVLPIDTFSALGGDALTDPTIDPMINPEIDVAATADIDLPVTFVPGRNVIFLSFAAAFAYQRGCKNIVTGVAQTDYSGYPDCRQDTINALQTTLRLAMEAEFVIHTPLMHLSKADTVRMAQENGAMSAMKYTHTCYLGAQPPCGECAACELRAKGFAEAGVADPLVSNV